MTLGYLLLALSLLWLAFAYVGYPLLALALARFSPRELRKGDTAPPLSLIIAVHNGEHALRQKLEATLALEYSSRVEVIVASDGSTDATDSIARELADRGVVLVRSEERRGKEAAQANAIQHARGEILAFSDLNAELARDALREIVRPFCDPSVGCVSSEDIVESAGGERSYVSLEMWLRRLETQGSTLVGLSGSFFAVRRELASPWPADLASDFRCALEAIRRGYRAVSEPRAGARFGATREAGVEWQRKVRTVRRGIAVLAAYRGLLHPRFGRAAFALWGHKVARFTSPFALIGLLLGSAFAASSNPLAAAFLAAQLAGYGLGALALAVPEIGARALPRLAGFFVLVNGAIVVAWAYHLAGRRAVTWQPTRR
ncbi:MAG TPA: glycosyltransferase [Myxococcota bacterium]|nr:glycosyltransferase [Myxococcota bacterium]